MSAQDVSANIPNGVSEQQASKTQGAISAQAGEPASSSRSCEGPQQTGASASSAGEAPRELLQTERPVPPRAAETEVLQSRTQQLSAVMMTDDTRQSVPENSGLVQRPIDSQGVFSAPATSATHVQQGQPSWISAMDVPRWFTRLGNMLQKAPGLRSSELAPSPFPGASPKFSTPPGGPTFRLRSPNRPRAISSAPTPPSSSSIPAEAIQAEVQRQLHGVLGQLREYGEENVRLREELEEARVQLRAQHQARLDAEQPTLGPVGLLGYVGAGSLDPGSLPGLPVPTSEPIFGGQEQVPECGGDRYMEPTGSLEDPYRTLQPNITGTGVAQVPGSSKPAPTPYAKAEEHHQYGQGNPAPGLLRSWWQGRPRSQTPPPRTGGASHETPVLEALARGVQQLQELQAQALTKASSAVSVEVVKPGTATLMPMPQRSDGADAAITFQDWVEISTSTMADISEASSTWWREVLLSVEQTYERWLAASPIERLGIEPTGTEALASGRWMRVNARAASMLLNSMSEELKGDMVARRCTQNCVKMMFRVFVYYQPGGSAERTDVLRRLQNPVDFCGGDSLEAVLRAVRSWPRMMERCRAVQMDPPDPSVLARGLLTLTDKFINESADASFRTSMLRTSLRLDANKSCPTRSIYKLSWKLWLQDELVCRWRIPS